MFGGLRLEMGMWNMLGDYLADSGWTTALADAGVAATGTADSFLKATHLTRTHHAHQLTCVALYVIFSNKLFIWLKVNLALRHGKRTWLRKVPVPILGPIEMFILIFVWACHENNFPLYVCGSLRRYCWVLFFLHLTATTMFSEFLSTLVTLPALLNEEFQKKWVVSKSWRRFSYHLISTNRKMPK